MPCCSPIRSTVPLEPIANGAEEEEAYLLEQEKFAEREEAKRIQELRDERLKQLEPFGYSGSVEFLGIASPSEFDLLLAGARSTHLEKLEDIARREREQKEQAERGEPAKITNA